MVAVSAAQGNADVGARDLQLVSLPISWNLLKTCFPVLGGVNSSYDRLVRFG